MYGEYDRIVSVDTSWGFKGWYFSEMGECNQLIEIGSFRILDLRKCVEGWICFWIKSSAVVGKYVTYSLQFYQDILFISSWIQALSTAALSKPLGSADWTPSHTPKVSMVNWSSVNSFSASLVLSSVVLMSPLFCYLHLVILNLSLPGLLDYPF